MRENTAEFQKTSDNCRLSAKQERAVLELVNPSTGTLEEVAKRIGVSERTLYNWLGLPHFQNRLQEERNRLRTEAFDKLKSTLNRAVERLSELLDSETETVRLRACQSVIDYNLKAKELGEFEERLRALEEAQERNRGRA